MPGLEVLKAEPEFLAQACANICCLSAHEVLGIKVFIIGYHIVAPFLVIVVEA